ncbi:MAG: hypothetical protein JSR37_06020 [Verrucomicrobia bacterium]|nr:hypothetical protein [Verrucomicrobiota bacterium]
MNITMHDHLGNLRDFFWPLAFADWKEDDVTTKGVVLKHPSLLDRLFFACSSCRPAFNITQTIACVQRIIKELPTVEALQQHTADECDQLHPNEDGTVLCLQASLLFYAVRKAIDTLNKHPKVARANIIPVSILPFLEVKSRSTFDRVTPFRMSTICRLEVKAPRVEPFDRSLAEEMHALRIRIEEEISRPGFSLQQLYFFTPELKKMLPSWLQGLLGYSLPAVGLLHLLKSLECSKESAHFHSQIVLLKEALETALIITLIIIEPSTERKHQRIALLEQHLYERFKALQTGQRMLVPAGFFNGNIYDPISLSQNDLGHFVLLEFHRKSDDLVDVHCYNTGDGVEFHNRRNKKILPWTVQNVSRRKVIESRFHHELAAFTVGGMDGRPRAAMEDFYGRLIANLLEETEVKKMVMSHQVLIEEQLFSDERDVVKKQLDDITLDELYRKFEAVDVPKADEPGIWKACFHAKKKLYKAKVRLHRVVFSKAPVEAISVRVDGVDLFERMHTQWIRTSLSQPSDEARISEALQQVKSRSGMLERLLFAHSKDSFFEFKSQNTKEQKSYRMQDQVASCAFSAPFAWLESTLPDKKSMADFMLQVNRQHIARVESSLQDNVVSYTHPIFRLGYSDGASYISRIFVAAASVFSDRVTIPIPAHYVRLIYDKSKQFFSPSK